MLKRWLAAWLLALMAVCMLMPGALAADVSLLNLPEDSDDYRYTLSCAAVGDTLYMLCNTNAGFCLYQWKDGMDDAELVTDSVTYAGYYGSMQELESYAASAQEDGREVDAEHAVGQLAAYQGKLMTINALNGRVFTITPGEDGVTFEDVATLKDTEVFIHQEEDYAYLAACSGMVSVGDRLLYLVQDWNDQGCDYKLINADLTTGEVMVAKAAMDDPQALSAYKDGKALVIGRDEDNAYDDATDTIVHPTVYAYDPVTDTAQELGRLEMDYVRKVAYSEQLDALIWLNNCRVMGTTDFATAKQYAYVPVNYTESVTVAGDSVAISGDAQMYIRTLSDDFRSDESLTVYGGYMDEGTMLFVKENPQIPVYSADDYYDSLEKLSQAMTTGDNALDVLTMNIGYSSFTTLMNKGYCADLSGDADLMAYVNRLYPVFRDAVMKDGRLCAIPLYAYSTAGWYVATGVMEEMGLTWDDIPKNFVDLCAFATRWNDEWVEEYPQFTLIEYTSDYKTQIFYNMLDGYLQYCTAKGQDVRFATETFRAMMEALEAMRSDDLSRGAQDANEDEVGYRQGLLMPYYSVVGDFYLSSEYRQFVPMTLTADTDFVTGVYLQVAMINPKSAHMESAMELLKCKVQALNESARHTLLTDETAPVLNKDYDRMLEACREYLDDLQNQLEEADEADKKEIQSWIDSEEAWIANYAENYRYDISEEAIRFYVEDIAPGMFVVQPTFRTGTEDNAAPELDTLIERYLAGQIDMEQFIKNADSKMMMMQLEDQ